MNIRLRLTLWYTAVFSLILLIFSLAVYAGLSRSLFNTIDNHLQREVSEILGNLKFYTPHLAGGEDDDEEDRHNAAFEQNGVSLNYIPEAGIYWRLLNQDGIPLIDPGHFDGAPLGDQPLDLSQTRLQNTTLANGEPVRLYTVPFEIEHQGQGVVQVAESYRHVKEVQGQLILLLALGLPLTLLASSAGGWFLASSALDPIDRITSTARQISARDLHQRLNLSQSNDEVGRLAATFDQMLDRLETAFEQQRRFIADASHEMKTPLTILKGDVDVALSRERSPDYYRRTLKRVNQTTDQLTALVQELLSLARADGDQLLLNIETFNLNNLLTALVKDLRPAAAQKKILLAYRANEPVIIQADQAKLRRLFLNLIDNAIKYSRPGDAVTLNISKTKAQAIITVSDTGSGISPEHLPHIFDRFYRVDKARSRAEVSARSSGSGLGLSIAHWITQAHRGEITVESVPGEGASFIVRLPLIAQAPTFEEGLE